MKIQTETIKIDTKDGVFDIVFSNTNEEIIYLLNKKLELLKIDINSGKTIFRKKIKKGNLTEEKSIKLHLCPLDDYVCMTNSHGQFGQVYDINKEAVILELDRKEYHTEQTVFPISFFRRLNQKDDRTYLIHASDWNHLDITDLKEQKLLTARQNEFKTDFYLDYFYGELHLSPSKNRLLSSGWVWQPASVFKAIDLENWLDKNINEPEVHNHGNHIVMSYSWDRALCWIDDTNIGFLYDPKEEDLDEEEYSELEISKDKNYIAIFDTTESKDIRYIEIQEYSKNEHFEETGDCQLFYQEHFIFSSKSQGVVIYHRETGAQLYQNKDIHFDKYNEALGLFYCLTEDSILLGKVIN